MSYYEELISKIKQNIEENNLDEAGSLLKNELKMPYIPIETEKELIKLNETLVSLSKSQSESSELSLDKIEEYLKNEPKFQLQAVAALATRNIRNHLDMIGSYLQNMPYPEAASLLIDILIEQQIASEFVYIKNDMEYKFIPCYIDRPHLSDGFIKANEYLKLWVESYSPSIYEMALQILIREVYLYLPLSYDEDDAVSLALSILKYVMDLMNDMEGFEQIVSNYKLKDVLLLGIHE